MKVLRRLPAEPWRDVIARLATDPSINIIGIDPEMMLEEFDYRTSELGESEKEVAWDLADAYGLLDELNAHFDEDEDEGVAA